MNFDSCGSSIDTKCEENLSEIDGENQEGRARRKNGIRKGLLSGQRRIGGGVDTERTGEGEDESNNEKRIGGKG